jgi:acyl-CoA thioester hydrolase
MTTGSEIDGLGPSSLLDGRTSERLISICPVIVRRRVLWGECDPAKVVYTPRFADYLAAAYGWFSRTILDEALVIDGEVRFATPMKALSLEFHHVLRPNDLFDMTVMLVDIRTRTFDLEIRAHSLDGEPRFTGRLSPIIVRTADFRSTELPDAARQALADYQRDCSAEVAKG